jgi:hypothetical protein
MGAVPFLEALAAAFAARLAASRAADVRGAPPPPRE